MLLKMPKEIFNINQFNLNMLLPNGSSEDKEGKGSQIIVIGKPKTGKTTVIKSLLYHKKHVLTGGLVMSGTESATGDYGQYFPPLFIYNKLNEDVLRNFTRRQKLISREIRDGTIHYQNGFNTLIIDDCTDKPHMLRSDIMQDLFKNGRHYYMFLILSLQYALDAPPNVRLNTAATFLLRETTVKTRKILYENFAGVIPSYDLFCKIMDEITNDYTALVICNNQATNNWQDNVFWYRADTRHLDNFKFGSKYYWDFNNERYNTNYRPTF